MFKSIEPSELRPNNRDTHKLCRNMEAGDDGASGTGSDVGLLRL